MHTKKQTTLANLGLLLAAAIWGGGFLAGKYALDEYPPFTILAFRFLGAALCIGILFCKQLQHTTKSTVQKGCVLGALQFIGLSVQLAGLNATTAGKQAFLVASYVMFVPFLAYFILKKRLHTQDILSAVLTLIGIGCISLSNDFSIHIGDLLSILFALIFAFQIIFVGAFVRNENPIQLSFYQFLSAGLFATVVMLFVDGVPKTCNLTTLYSLLYLIVLNTVIAFTIQNVAQRYTSETTASILIALESFFGFLFSVLFLQEPITPKVILGCVFIFSAVILSKIQIKKDCF